MQAVEAEPLSSKLVVRLTAETYAARFSTLALSLVSNILLARMLGPEGKGYVAAALLWSGTLASLLIFGLDSSAVYFIGQSPGRFRRLVRIFVVYALAMGLVGTILLHGINHWSGVFGGETGLVWAVSALLLTGLLTVLFNALYIGLGQLSRTNRVAVVGAALTLIFLLASYVVGASSLRTVVLGIAGLQAVIAAYLVIRALTLPRIEPAFSIRWPDFGRYSFKAYAGNLAGILYSRSNLMILSVSASMSEVGIYSIALVFADVVLILPNTLINIIFPKVAAMSTEQAVQRISETCRFATVVALAIAVGVGLAATLVIPVAFGSAFQPAVGMAWILCAGAWLGTSGMVLSIYFYGAGRPEVPASASWLGFAFVAALTYGLAPRWGGYGAAVAVSLSRLVVAGYMLIRYLRDSRERWTRVVLPGPADWQRGAHLVQDLVVAARQRPKGHG